jgi:hypothetical protein
VRIQKRQCSQGGRRIKIQTKGNTVALGKVGGASFEDRSPNNGYICIYPFSVSSVPAGEKFYTVVVDGQGVRKSLRGTSQTARLSW